MEIAQWVREATSDIGQIDVRWLLLVPGGAFVAYHVVRRVYQETQLPPGPVGWPWFGYTRCMGKNSFDEVQLLCKKYGPVTSFRLCGQLIVILSDKESINEAGLTQRTLIGRHTMLTNHLLANGFGISNYDGDNAVLLRRIFVRAIHLVLPEKVKKPPILRDHPDPLPIDFQRLDLLINEKLEFEMAKFTESLRQANGESVFICTKFRQLVWQIIWRAMFGENCPFDDITIADLLQSISVNNTVNGPFQFKQMLPNYWSGILRHSEWARKVAGVDQIWDRYHRVTRMLTEAVNEAIKNPNLPEQCILSQFLNTEEYEVSPGNAYRLAFELMAAGVDTTALTLVWCCNAIASGKLKIAHNEIFTNGHLEVVHRLASVVPMALPHRARFNARINGYLIPRGSVVFFNLFAVHQDQLEELERCRNSPGANGGVAGGCPFNSKGSNKKPYLCESAIPFSVGNRACPGFKFATRMITRIMTKVIANFSIKECHHKSLVEDDNTGGLTRPPISGRYNFYPVSCVS